MEKIKPEGSRQETIILTDADLSVTFLKRGGITDLEDVNIDMLTMYDFKFDDREQFNKAANVLYINKDGQIKFFKHRKKVLGTK